jgi:hypothetical protein
LEGVKGRKVLPWYFSIPKFAGDCVSISSLSGGWWMGVEGWDVLIFDGKTPGQMQLDILVSLPSIWTGV